MVLIAALQLGHRSTKSIINATMASEQRTETQAPSLQRGKDPNGCLPLYCCLCAIPLALILLYTQINMPEQASSLGEGNIYHKNTPFTYAHAHTQSPLPLTLPSYADPAQSDEFGSSLNTQRKEKFNAPPASGPYTHKRSSAVLESAQLLQDPPFLQEQKKAQEKKIEPSTSLAQP